MNKQIFLKTKTVRNKGKALMKRTAIALLLLMGVAWLMPQKAWAAGIEGTPILININNGNITGTPTGCTVTTTLVTIEEAGWYAVYNSASNARRLAVAPDIEGTVNIIFCRSSNAATPGTSALSITSNNATPCFEVGANSTVVVTTQGTSTSNSITTFTNSNAAGRAILIRSGANVDMTVLGNGTSGGHIENTGTGGIAIEVEQDATFKLNKNAGHIRNTPSTANNGTGKAIVIGSGAVVEIINSGTANITTSGAGNAIEIGQGAKVTLNKSGGSISTSGGNAIVIGDEANIKMIISGSTSITAGNGGTAITIGRRAVVDMSNADGTATGTGDITTGTGAGNVIVIGQDAKLTMNKTSGNFTAAGGKAISIGNGAEVDINIGGGNITATTGSAIAIDDGATVIITKSAGNITTTTGSAIAIGNGADVTISKTGGNISSSSSGNALLVTGSNTTVNLSGTTTYSSNSGSVFSIGADLNNVKLNFGTATTGDITSATGSAISIGARSENIAIEKVGGTIQTTPTAANIAAISIGAGADVTMTFDGTTIQSIGAANGALAAAIQIAAGTGASNKTKVDMDFNNCILISRGGNTNSINDLINAGNFTDVKATITNGSMGVLQNPSRLFVTGTDSEVDLTLNGVRGRTGNNLQTTSAATDITFLNDAIVIGSNTTVKNLKLQNVTLHGTAGTGNGLYISQNVGTYALPAKVTFDGASITSTVGCAFTIDRNSNVELTLDAGVNTLQSGIRSVTGNYYVSYAGLFVHPGNLPFDTNTPWNNPGIASLTIKGTGTLNTTGGNTGGTAGSNNNNGAVGAGAGIGGHGHGKINDNGSGGGGTESTNYTFGGHSGTITIKGGIINATGGNNTSMLNGGTGAGIGGGGGWRTDGGSTIGAITIECGVPDSPVVTAKGGTNSNGQNTDDYGGGGGAGIGGGGAGITGKIGGSNLGGIYVFCGKVTATGGGTSGTGQGAGGAGIGGGGAFKDDFGGKGNHPLLTHFSIPPAEVDANGGTGSRGKGSNIGDGGRQGDPVITNITPSTPVLEIYKPMVKGQSISMTATVTDPVGATKFEWFISTSENYGGKHIDELPEDETGKGKSTFTIGSEIDEYIALNEVYYYCIVKSYDALGNAVLISESSPNIKVVLQDFKDPTLEFLRNGTRIPYSETDGFVTGFTPVTEATAASERITITIRNTGNIPWLDVYNLKIEVKSLPGDLFLNPVVIAPFDLEVGGTKDIELDSYVVGKTISGSPYEQKINVASDVEGQSYGHYETDITVSLHVVEHLVTKVEVINDPENPFNESFPTTWFVGQPLDLSKLKVELTYEGGHTEDVEFEKFGGALYPLTLNTDVFDHNKPVTNAMGNTDLRVTYGNNPSLSAVATRFTVIPTAQVTVIGGKVTDPAETLFPGESGNFRYMPANNITIEADPEVGGKKFVKWEFVKGAPPAGFDVTEKVNTFMVFTDDLIIRAVFIYAINYEVIGDGKITDITITDTSDEEYMETVDVSGSKAQKGSFEVEAGKTVTYTAEADANGSKYRAEWKITENDDTPFTIPQLPDEGKFILTSNANANATILLTLIKYYNVEFEVDGGNGSITARVAGESADFTSPGQVDAGKTIDFSTIQAEDYRVAEWTVNGTTVLDGDENVYKDGIYELEGLDDDVMVKVRFEPIPPPDHKITFSIVGGSGGSLKAFWQTVNEQTATTVPVEIGVYEGDDVIFTATPAPGFRVKEWIVYGNRTAADNDDMTVYTLWNITEDVEVTVEFVGDNHHLVTFMVEGDIYDVQAVAKSGGKAVDPGSPTSPDDDSLFKGWFEFNNDIPWDFNSPVESDLTLYAHWVPDPGGITDPVVVIFIVDGQEYDVQVIQSGTVAAVPADPADTETHLFNGWYENPESGTAWLFSTPITANKILFAQWYEIPDDVTTPVTVTFIVDGSVWSRQVISSGTTAVVPDPRPADTNTRLFNGWYENETGGTAWQFNTSITSSKTLYAQWYTIPAVTDPVTVTFMVDGSVWSRQVIQKGTTAIPPVTPVDPARVFIGWFTENLFYWDINAPVTQSMTLTAKWTPVVSDMYVVTFVPNNGVDEPFTNNVAPGSSVGEPAEPNYDGHIFNGWYKEGVQWNFTNPVPGNMTLVADWIIEKYDFTFMANGVVWDKQEIAWGETAGMPAAPTKSGYLFAGWYEDSECDENTICKNPWNFNTAVVRNVELYADWDEINPAQWTVTFVMNDGTSVQKSKSVPKSPLSKVDRLSPDPVRDDYTFVGWYNSSGDEWNFEEDYVEQDMFLYAVWSSNNSDKFTVTFFYNDDATNPATVLVTKNTAITNKPANPVRNGYTFTGWYTETGVFWNFGNIVTRDLFLYANWEVRTIANTVSVTFVYNDGATSPKTEFVAENTTITEPAVPVRTGFTFKGWNTESGAKWIFSSMVTNDMFLYADWESNRPGTFAVTFVFNDGVTAPHTEFVTANTAITGKPADPVKEGYVFTGWYDASGFIWNFNNKVEREMFLYAGWAVRITGTYSVTFVYNDNVTNPTTVFIPENTAITNKPADPVRDGYAFTGWYTEAGVFWNFVTPVTRDMFLYAGWEERIISNTYSVTFVYNNGTTSPKTEFVTKNTPVGEPAVPVRTGFTFKGWNTELGAKWIFSSNVTEDMFLYADWESDHPNTYSVTFVKNDGTFDFNTVFVPENTPVTKPADPVRNGYVFVGWYNESGSIWDFDDNVTRNMFLYAGWKVRIPNMYGVTFVYNDNVTNPTSVLVLENTPVTKPADPVRNGYTFTGWYTETGVFWNFDNLVTKDLFLYANWEERTTTNPVSVTFVYNDGATSPQTEFVTINTPVNEPAEPFRTGFTFKGWNDESGTKWIFDTPVTEDMFLYADWESNYPNTFAVTFVYNNGVTAPHTEFVPKNTAMTNKPADPVKAGYLFTGWYDVSGLIWNLNNIVERDMFLYAGWEELEADDRVVTFVSNNGDPNIYKVVKSGNTVNPPDVNPVKTDYTFLGWFTVDGGNTLFNFDTPVTTNLTLYAGWVDKDVETVKVTFKLQNGEPDIVKVIVKDNPVTQPSDPTQTGYLFTGWFTSDNFLWDFATPVAENMTLNAGWAELKNGQYAVTFIFNNGDAPNTEYVDIGQPIAKPEDPTKTGYNFNGWFTSGGMEWNFATPVEGNMTLIAEWGSGTGIITYSVNFSVTGSNGTLIATVDGNEIQSIAKVEEGKKVIFTATPATGYRVSEWRDNGSKVNATTVTGIIENYELPDLSGDHIITVAFEQTPTFLVTVVAGNGSTGGGYYQKGDEVTIYAGTLPNQQFVRWSSTNTGVSFINRTSATTTFIMPESDATVTAEFAAGLSFTEYVVQKWNNTFVLNVALLKSKNSILRDGFTCEWFADGQSKGTGYYYTAGDDGQTLTPGVKYSFVLTAGTSKLFSDDGFYVPKTSTKAYPNPVVSGKEITIEGIDEGNPIRVYNQAGVCVSNTIASGDPTTLVLQVPAGLYLIHTNNGDIKIVVE